MVIRTVLATVGFVLLVVSAASAEGAGEGRPVAGPAATPASTEIVGRSVDGLPIRARRVGSPSANPDGGRSGTRWNARGIDLNRNFAFGWQPNGAPFDTYHSGPAPASEPETGALSNLIRRVQPRVVQTPIPFGQRRRREMRAYADRHYGIDDYRLRRPRVIVEHYTASNSFSSAFDTFAADTPDVELGELPGVCAHYLIDRDGTVHQLVPTSIMCRHTVGLNWTAIGIEHVGISDSQVLANRRQRAASLRLTRMLQGRHRIATRDVIGHAESLSSPFHRERVARLRTQTHGDFAHSTMRGYRRLLSRMAASDSVR